jgi:hypothetical protein
MIFLISYDRLAQRIIGEVEQFSDDQAAVARERRLERQLALPREDGHVEVVLLEAESLNAIKETHARYFAVNETELIDQARAELGESRAHARTLREPATKK